MAATAFKLYNEAKKYIGSADLDLDLATFKMKLCTSASNAETLTLSTFASVTGEVTPAGGYVANGKALTGVTWAQGASAQQYRFDADNIVYTASGAEISNIKYAVIGISGGKVLCWSKLTATQFNLAAGNTLTVAYANPDGIFTLV
jgi:hypothetical protein